MRRRLNSVNYSSITAAKVRLPRENAKAQNFLARSSVEPTENKNKYGLNYIAGSVLPSNGPTNDMIISFRAEIFPV